MFVCSGRRSRHIKKASSSVLSLASKNLANSRCDSKSKATVDVLGMCLYASPYKHNIYNDVYVLKGEYIYISAWAIALLVLVTSGNARAFRSGMSGKGSSHVFFLCRKL